MSNKKQIFKINTLRKLLTDENSCVSLVPCTRLLALPPFFLNDMKSGILYLLNNMLKKYDLSLGGIIIGYQNIKVLMDENTGIIPIGTSETEVNISVEFYIFQPKIGSFLEGIVNKKSNSHIGCLVHRYFNATILKPDYVDFDDWVCQRFNVDDKIIFKVKDLDFTSLLPHIEGIIDDEKLLDKVKCNLNGRYDTGSDTVSDINERCLNKDSFTKDILLHKQLDKEEASTLNDNVSENLFESDSLSESRKKKKKKKKKEKEIQTSVSNHNKSRKEESSNDKELNLDNLSKESNTDERHYKKKKNKKDKKKYKDEKNEKDENNVLESSTNVENVGKEDNLKSGSILEKLVLVEDKNMNDFVKPRKIKIEKKIKNKKNDLEEPCLELNKASQGLYLNEAEDNIFYSTQLGSPVPKKMKISFCSPISKASTLLNVKSPEQDKKLLTNEYEVVEKEKKHKNKKRKREEGMEPESLSSCKKVKSSHSYSFVKEDVQDEMKSDENKLIVQTMMDELYKQQLNIVKESLITSDKESSKDQKKKKEKSKKEEKEVSKEKLINLDKSNKCEINGRNGNEQDSETQNLLEKLRKQEMQRVKEALHISAKEECKETKKTKTKDKKEKKTLDEKASKDSCSSIKSTKTQLNGTEDVEKKSLVQSMMDQLLQQEINKVNEKHNKSDAKNSKEENKEKELMIKSKGSKKKTHDSLYKKLLKDAKIAIDLEKNKCLTLPISKGSDKKKKNLIYSSTSCLKTKGSEEKAEISHQDTKDFYQTPEKYKNGSMYDMADTPADTPEKLHFEKSLFSDSEYSHKSPSKKKKENVIETGSERETRETEKSRSSKKKERKNKKSESKTEIENIIGQEQESLYEKLLREAKNLVHTKIESTSKKEKNI